MDCFRLAQDRDRWRALLNTVFHKKRGVSWLIEIFKGGIFSVQCEDDLWSVNWKAQQTLPDLGSSYVAEGPTLDGVEYTREPVGIHASVHWNMIKRSLTVQLCVCVCVCVCCRSTVFFLHIRFIFLSFPQGKIRRLLKNVSLLMSVTVLNLHIWNYVKSGQWLYVEGIRLGLIWVTVQEFAWRTEENDAD